MVSGFVLVRTKEVEVVENVTEVTTLVVLCDVPEDVVGEVMLGGVV